MAAWRAEPSGARAQAQVPICPFWTGGGNRPILSVNKENMAMKMLSRNVQGLILALFAMSLSHAAPAASANAPGLWKVYEEAFARAKYVDLTHTIAPGIPVWKGFGPSKFAPTLNPQTGQPYDYKTDGFAATHYDLSTDQLGTQLDPPAHWAPEYPAIDELPATYAVRPLVVISITD